MSSRLTGGLCAVLAAITCNVHAVIIDFQSLEHVDDLQINHGITYTEDGFTVGTTPLYTNGTLNSAYRGSTAMFYGLQGTDASLTASGGGAFDLTSIDLAEVDPGMATVKFIGHLLSGGTVNQSFTLDGIFTTGSGFETFVFNGFNNITSLVWSNNNPFHQFDNIVVSSVPVPAAIWLFGSGLLGLFAVSRRRRLG